MTENRPMPIETGLLILALGNLLYDSRTAFSCLVEVPFTRYTSPAEQGGV